MSTFDVEHEGGGASAGAYDSDGGSDYGTYGYGGDGGPSPASVGAHIGGRLPNNVDRKMNPSIEFVINSDRYDTGYRNLAREGRAPSGAALEAYSRKVHVLRDKSQIRFGLVLYDTVTKQNIELPVFGGAIPAPTESKGVAASTSGSPTLNYAWAEGANAVDAPNVPIPPEVFLEDGDRFQLKGVLYIDNATEGGVIRPSVRNLVTDAVAPQESWRELVRELLVSYARRSISQAAGLPTKPVRFIATFVFTFRDRPSASALQRGISTVTGVGSANDPDTVTVRAGIQFSPEGALATEKVIVRGIKFEFGESANPLRNKFSDYATARGAGNRLTRELMR